MFRPFSYRTRPVTEYLLYLPNFDDLAHLLFRIGKSSNDKKAIQLEEK